MSKNVDELKACMKVVNAEFNVIGLCETHLKDKPNDYLNLPGYNIECANRISREKGGVCMLVSDTNANVNYESCFIEIECKNLKNVVVGVVYRAHTAIDNFIIDIDPVFKVLNQEKKQFYVMGNFNIDLLKVDSHRPTHDFLELIYSYTARFRTL